VALLAWVVATRVLRVARPTAGSMMVSSIQGNTGYLGPPVTFAVLGAGALGNAIAYDTIMSAATLLLGSAAIGAALGERVGDRRRARVRSFVARNPPLIAVVLGRLAPDALARRRSWTSRTSSRSPWPRSASSPLARPCRRGRARRAGPALGGWEGPPGAHRRRSDAEGAGRAAVASRAHRTAGRPAAGVPSPGCDAVRDQRRVIAHAYGLDLRTSADAIPWSTAIVVVAATIGAVV